MLCVLGSSRFIGRVPTGSTSILMPIPRLSIESPDEGLPRQPVPLRYAYLVTGLPFSEFLFLLAKRQEGRYEYLTGYEYVAGAEPREVRAAVYAEILEATTNEESAQELLKRLPSNHFVWSDELAAAFSQFILDHPGVDTAQAQGMGLCWNPALLGLDALIKECVDLGELSDFSARVDDAKSSNDAYLFRRSPAGGWDIRFEGHPCGPFKDSRGLHYIKHILQSPGKSLSPLELSALVQEPALSPACAAEAEAALATFENDDEQTAETLTVSLGGHAGEVIDDRARNAYVAVRGTKGTPRRGGRVW